MTGINRIGQKVECIYRYFKRDWCPDVDPVPEYKGEYTVNGFEDYFGQPGIHLMEFTKTKCVCLGGRIPWPIICFRPLVNDEIKNEHVTEIIDKVTVTKKEKEKA